MPELFIPVEIKTLFAGKAWVHQKYLKTAQALKKGIKLKLKTKGMTEEKIMFIPPQKIKASLWIKGDRQYLDKFSGEPYYLYGIHFIEHKK